MWKVIFSSRKLEEAKHINIVHNGQKDHKCDSCAKSFSQASKLKAHINSIHNGQKDHKPET